MSEKLRIVIITVAVALPADQLSKWWIVSSLEHGASLTVIPGVFELAHVRNAGAAFGLLAHTPEPYRTLIFVIAGALAVAVIVFFFRNLAPRDRLSALALALILGGALGNLSDRIFRGEVVDLIRLRLFGGYAWPDFNVADVCIVAGVGALIVELLTAEGEARAAVSTRDGSAGEGDH